MAPGRSVASVGLQFERLAGAPPDAPVVSPSLPRVLDLLARRDLSATFFVEAAVVEHEPFALAMIANGLHEIGAVLEAPPDPLRALTALEAAGHTVAGLAGAQVDAAVADAHPALRYVSVGVGEPTVASGRLVAIPFDPAIATRTRFATGGPAAWHAGAQVAVAAAVSERRHVTLPMSLDVFERGDAVGVLAETLDLVAGLRRAGSLTVATLAEVATAHPDRRPRQDSNLRPAD